MENHIFATVLRSQRIAAGYNQTEAANQLYMTRSTYQHYEAGRRTPSVDTIIRICVLFKIHPVDLICTFIPKDIQESAPDFIDILYCGKYAFTSDETRILSHYNALQDDEKEIIRKLLYSLSVKQPD